MSEAIFQFIKITLEGELPIFCTISKKHVHPKTIGWIKRTGRVPLPESLFNERCTLFTRDEKYIPLPDEHIKPLIKNINQISINGEKTVITVIDTFYDKEEEAYNPERKYEEHDEEYEKIKYKIEDVIYEYQEQLIRLVEEDDENNFINVLTSVNKNIYESLLESLIPDMFEISSEKCENVDLYINSVIERYFSIHEYKQKTRSLLKSACSKGNLKLVKNLIDYGFKDYDNVAINKACNNGHLDVVRFLVEKEISSFDIDDSGFKLPYDHCNKHRHIIQYIMEKTGRYHDAITYALECDDHDMVRWLVEGDESREDIKITKEYIESQYCLRNSKREEDRDIYSYLKSKVSV